MPDPEIRTVDPFDGADLRRWWTSGHLAGLADRPYDAWPPWELSRQALPQRREDHRLVLLAARTEGREAGAAMVRFPLLDNLHTADVTVWVRPEERCRGVGTALLAAAEGLAADGGRTTWFSEAHAPPGASGPGPVFAERRGWSVAEENEAKLLDLGTAPASWRPLAEECSEHRGGYAVETSVDRVPEAHVGGLCALLSVFVGMLPASERDQDDVVWTPGRLRAGEARNATHDRRQVMAVALAPDGRVVGFSDLRADAPTSPLAGVGGTLVLPDHRGHRLGLALKLATHAALLDLREAGRVTCTHVETQNATDNAAMNHVNDRLGYRVVERALDLQKRPGPVV